MPVVMPLSVLVLGVSALFIAYHLLNLLLSPLRSIPGPFLARYTRLWYLKKVYDGDFEKVNIKLHEKYGPLVRIAPNEYSVSDPAALKIIYGHGSAFVKAPWYRASGNSHYGIHDIFTDEDPKRHSDNRRKVASLFSLSSLLQYESYVELCTESISKKFLEFAKSSESIDLQQWLQFFAFDVVGYITLSKPFGFLESGEDIDGMISALHSYTVYASHVGIFSELHPYVSRLMSLLPASGIDYLTVIARKQLNSALTVKTEGASDFMSKMTQMHRDEPGRISVTDILTTCLVNIGAGSDTTSISLSGILYHIIKAPEVLKKLQHEIDTKIGKSKSGYVNFATAQEMPYLQACIKEGLRMHPATGLPLARVVPRGGTTLCGKFIPQNTIVGVNAWVMNYNKSVYGPDADVYRPERWLEDSVSVAAMDRAFSTFGHGSRTCIGKNMSIMEISRLVPELLRQYNFHLATTERLETRNTWFVKQNNFRCRISEREST